MNTERGRHPAPAQQRDEVRRLVDMYGEQHVADTLHVTRWTVGRVLAGLPLQESTRALISIRLEEASGG